MCVGVASGDSGGPMFLVDKETDEAKCLYGIAGSMLILEENKGLCEKSTRNVFTNVTFFAPFINIVKQKYEPESIENPEDITNKITLEAVIHFTF